MFLRGGDYMFIINLLLTYDAHFIRRDNEKVVTSGYIDFRLYQWELTNTHTIR